MLMLLVTLAAALASHLVIDQVGDYVLAHDAYDGIAHNSRSVGALAFGACLLATLGFALRAALLEAQGNEGALLAVLRRASPRYPWRNWAALTASSLMLVAAMEACDAWAVGRPCDDPADLLGGSLSLGILVSAFVAGVLSLLSFVAMRRLAALHRVIVGFVEAFIAIVPPDPLRCGVAGRVAPPTPGAPSAVLSRSAGGRAPPIVPSHAWI